MPNPITKSLYKFARNALPEISETEQAALEAGGLWFDAEIFSGNPDWSVLREAPGYTLTEAEQAFIDGPVEELCNMLDPWEIEYERKDLPPEVWDFIRQNKFFGMIIPEEYGGLGFSALCHSEVIRKLSSRSGTGAVSVMVPNSLGPGELLMHFGTDEQKNYWLPRLAKGEEIPCFGLTETAAGSDAGAMESVGVVEKATVDGKETLGIRLNFNKRYITLGPIATVMGVAFKLEDPDGLLGDQKDVGITLALIPSDTPGVTHGKRHYASRQAFQNGPLEGKDVFVPLDWIIGGQEYAGQGWMMLMSALSVGRGISLPSQSAAGASLALMTTGAYARCRHQFNISIAEFEGIQERIAALAAHAYQLDAARRVTARAVDEGHAPSVLSAIVKAHATYRLREATNDAMDVHAGKAVIDGPKNYLGDLYRAVPVAITVEGANILTRNLMIFGQGAIRAHPYLLDEIMAASDEDEEAGLEKFSQTIWKHAGHQAATFFRAFARSWTGGASAPYPDGADDLKQHYKQLGRYSSVLAFVSEIALVHLGGALKRKEFISARLGDILSEVYLLSCALKRFEEDGKPREDRPVLGYVMQAGYQRIEQRLTEVIDNYPSRPLAALMRFTAPSSGKNGRAPDDQLAQRVSDLVTTDTETRTRLMQGLYIGSVESSEVARLERAFKAVTAAEPLYRKRRHDEALTEAETRQLEEAESFVREIVEVDSFDPEVLTGISGAPAAKHAAE